MHARDAAGRQVSLLNDDGLSSRAAQRPSPYSRPQSYRSSSTSQPWSYSRSNSSSPNTPELMRSDSYDSQTSRESPPPPTPSDYAFPRSSLFSLGSDYGADAPPKKRPGLAQSSRSTSYDDDANSVTSPATDRPIKRYPCRYRESHGCEKTFTTSGHASRHSKIHTAEKAVQCTFSGCQKKFTRADNMKQHLETHYKDKSRASGGPRSQKSLAGARRNSSSGRGRSSASGRESKHADAEQLPLPTPPLPSPGAFDMRGLNVPLMSRPVAARTPSSGLDALAMAIACQEGS